MYTKIKTFNVHLHGGDNKFISLRKKTLYSLFNEFMSNKHICNFSF